MKTLILGFFVGMAFTIIASLAAEDQYKVHIESYQMGMKHALRLDPVAWELEETCLNLWMKEQ